MDNFTKVEERIKINGTVPVVYINSIYQVNVREEAEGVTWLSIKRRDKESIHDWRELQEIKNKLCGPEREGLELYPAESRLVDTSNQFHIFVLPKGEKFPYGYGDRLIVEGHEGELNKGSKQRPFKEDQVPSDIKTLEQIKQLEKHRENGKK